MFHFPFFHYIYAWKCSLGKQNGAGRQPDILGSFPRYPNLNVACSVECCANTDPKQPRSLQSKCKKMHRKPAYKQMGEYKKTVIYAIQQVMPNKNMEKHNDRALFW